MLHCRITVPALEAVAGKSVARLRLFAPDGNEWKAFAASVPLEQGRGDQRIRLPYNTPRGTWRIEAREAISGRMNAADIEIP